MIALWFFTILILAFIFIYNLLIHLRTDAIKAKSVIDVYLQQRFDLIPNLIEVTKGYSNYEKDILTKITMLRASYKENKDKSTEEELNKTYNDILLNLESYPNLKATEQYLNLQKTLSKVENQLQAARRVYNNAVTKYNTKLKIFPINIFAKIFSFKEMDLFVLEGLDTVKIDFR